MTVICSADSRKPLAARLLTVTVVAADVPMMAYQVAACPSRLPASTREAQSSRFHVRAVPVLEIVGVAGLVALTLLADHRTRSNAPVGGVKLAEVTAEVELTVLVAIAGVDASMARATATS
jgi:hypothetical protein